MKKELHTLVLLLALFTTSLAYVKNTEDLHDINILKQHFDDSVGFSQWYNQLSQENKNLVLAGTVYVCRSDLAQKTLAMGGNVKTKLMTINITAGHDDDFLSYIYAYNSGNIGEFITKTLSEGMKKSKEVVKEESCGHAFSTMDSGTPGLMSLISASVKFCQNTDKKVEMLQILTKNGLDINEINDLHISPLSEAIESKDLKMVEHLLQNGADFSKTYALSKMIDNYYSYETDADTEAIWNYVIAYLKEHKLTPEAETDAYIRGRLKYEEEFKSKMERLSLQPDYNTLAAKEGLLAAADRYEHDLLRELIDNGVDVNYQDKYGRTALFFIVKEASDPEGVYDAKYLLDNGADANIKDHNGKTAFDSCSEKTCWLDPKKK